MVVRPVRAVAVVVGVLAAFLAIGGPASAEDRSPDADAWTATAASGAVEVRPAYEARDHWSRVRTGDRLEPLATVRTGRRGRTTLMQDDHRMLVRPDSEIELPVLVGTETTPQVLHGRGSVSYEVEADLPHFEVVTPYLIADASGAAFGIDVEDGRARIHVLSGDVAVTSRIDGSTAGLEAGDSALVDVTEPEPIQVRRTHALPTRRVYGGAATDRPVSGPALPTR